MRGRIWMIAGCLALASAVGAQPVSPLSIDLQPTTQPAASPEDAKVMSDLVRELGDDNPKVRSKAAAILRRHGKDALDALASGAKDSDLQVRASSQTLIDQINNPAKYRAPAPVPSPAPGDFALQQRGLRIMRVMPNAQVQIHANIMEIGNNVTREMSIIENGRSVRIHEDPNKITVTVLVNGQTEHYEATNADELKTKSPEGYKIYERYAKPR
jgi:hypothetical protein